MSSIEHEIMIFLEKHNIQYEYEKNFSWLKQQRLDFFLPDYNIAIECQGEQHFKAQHYFGGIDNLKKQNKNDILKFNLCKEHNIKILYYTHIKNVQFFEELIYDQISLLYKIQIK